MNVHLPPSTGNSARSLRFVATFIVTAVLFALGQFHRSSGSVLSSVFSDEFGLRADQIGIVIGIMFIAQGVGQIPSGVLIDRYGTRRTLALMSVLAAAGCLIVAIATSWTWLMLGRAMIGFGFSAAMMGSFKLFADWVPPAALTTLTGRYMFFGLMGGLLATTPLVLMLDQLGWRAVFVIFAGATTVMGSLIALVVRDRPPAMAHAQTDAPETLLQVIRGTASVIRRRALRPLLFAALLIYTPGQILVGLWAAPYLADVHHLPPLQRSYCLVSMVVGMTIGPLAYGYLDRHGQSRWRIVRGGAMLVALAFLALALVGQAHWLLATALCALICGASTFFLLILSHAQMMFRPNYAGRVVSTFGVIAMAGVFLAQSGSAVILGRFPAPGMTAAVAGYQTLFALMALTSLTVAALCLWFQRTTEDAAQGPHA